MEDDATKSEGKVKVTFTKKQIGETTNYYFSPPQILTFWNGYITDIVNDKTVVMSFDKDKNYLLYKLLQKKGNYLKQLVELSDDISLNLYSEGERYFYVRIFVPKTKMFYFRKSKGLLLKEAIVQVSNIWNTGSKWGFHLLLKTFKFSE
jgi:hypothetical protein